MLSVIFVGCCVLFLAAYKFYGGWMEQRLDVMDERLTPAHTMRDGVDYEPGADAVVFGHHFSSIAGAGPIVGPIAAALVFGWGPALAWIVLGVIFVGGVQDYTSMIASIRNRGKSLAQIGRDAMGGVTYRLFLLFILLVLLYVIMVFLDITAATFAPQTLARGRRRRRRRRRAGWWRRLRCFIFCWRRCSGGWCIGEDVAEEGYAVGGAAGVRGDLAGEGVPAFTVADSFVLGEDKYFWSLILLVYCVVASVLPVWALLAEGLLSSFLLYACAGRGGGADVGVVHGGDGDCLAGLDYGA